MRRAVYGMMRWWLDRGVDGFRMDVINLISKQVGPGGALPDGVAQHGGALGDGTPFIMNGPRIHEFLQEMNREVLAGRNLITVGETPGATVADAVLYTDPARGEVNMVFTFEHMELDSAPGSAAGVGPQATGPAGPQGQPHRLAGGPRRDRLELPLLEQPISRASLSAGGRWPPPGGVREDPGHGAAPLRGTPYVYQGEFGMTNAHFACSMRDIESSTGPGGPRPGRAGEMVMRSLAVKSQDNARTPVQWDASANAGFTTGAPWIAVNPNHAEINAVAAVADPDSVFHHYRRLIELRHALPVVVHGDYRLLAPDHQQVFAYVRTLGGERLLVVANLSGEDATVDLGDDAALLGGDVVLAVGSDGGGVGVDGGALAGGRLTLAPWESRVVLNR